jgi:D-alanyl-D-alanine carboxypeptidase
MSLYRKLSARTGTIIAAGTLSCLLAACTGSSSPPAPVACVSQTVAQAAFAPDVVARLQKVLDRNKAIFGFPGAQAGVWTASGSWVGVTGSASLSAVVAPTRGHHTRIGSITKTFTVMLLLQQVDKGLVSLDDPIGKYVAGLPNGDSATLRMLASMTSGIPSYTFDPGFQQTLFDHPDTLFSPQQVLDYVRGARPLFAPGTRVDYSNSNTVALGLVIEQVTGKPFGQALQDDLLDPLGLSGTSFPGTSPALPAPYLEGITMQGQPAGRTADATNWTPSWNYSSGALISTIDDLRCWAVTLGTGGGLISGRLQQERLASVGNTTPPNTPAKAYALGFGVFNGWIGHTGELPGYNSAIMVDPASGTTVVVMVNSDIPFGPPGFEQSPAPTISDQLIAAMAAQ